jgi:hypothetical protein
MKTAAGLLLALLLAGCAQGPSTRMIRLFGGAENVEIVASADRVEASRLRPPSRSGEGAPNYSQWPVVGAPVRVPPEIASRFSRGLTSESTYTSWDEGKGCIPTPGLKLRFTRDGRSLDVVFCFECGMLFTYRGEQAIWGGNFDGSAREILPLFLQLFPGDSSLPRMLEHGKNP